MKIFFTFLIVFVTCICNTECTTKANDDTKCTILTEIDGCSIPLQLPFFYKQSFTPACTHHDVCYRCGHPYGWTQDTCDTIFKTNMYAFCMKRSGTRSKRSLSSIWKYFIEMTTVFRVFTEGLMKSLKHKTPHQEFKRLTAESNKVFKMLMYWPMVTNPKRHCEYGADIYHKLVTVFGVYKFRFTNADICTEPCVNNILAGKH